MLHCVLGVTQRHLRSYFTLQQGGILPILSLKGFVDSSQPETHSQDLQFHGSIFLVQAPTS